MATIAEKIAAAKKCCRESITRKADEARKFYDKFFNGNWKVFVVKKDETSGKLVGKTVCCADSPA